MREIKFRCQFDGDYFYGTNNSKEWNDIDILPLQEFFRFVSDYNLEKKIQQYTGIKDKNGKEIFEGDIMVLNKLNPSYYVVKYDENRFFLDGMSIFDKLYSFEEREVVGNIYQNPELLKKTKC